jgi:homoserine dehydrogenase
VASVDVPVALLGYGTVGSAVGRLLEDQAADIERATGHRLRVVRALVRDPGKERGQVPVTTDFAEIRDDPEIAVVAEVMGGLEPAGDYVLELLRAGKPVVTANKQLVARRSAELFAAAAEGGVQLRFEASVCAAIPVIKVLREALVVSNVHRVLGIVNGTTNFVLTEMEGGASYDDALAEAQRLGFAEADPTEDVSGQDAAAKMAILATVAFGSRVTLEDVAFEGIERVAPEDVAAARDMEMVVRLIGAATLVDGQVDVRVRPALVDRRHPLAAVEGAFNGVMLQGDAIREITLEGPGAGGLETASAVVADMVTIVGTTGTGFLQNDACWRELPRLPEGEVASPFYLRVEVADRPGVLALVAQRLAAQGISIARLVQHQADQGATLHVVTHEAPAGRLRDALDEIDALEETRGAASALPVISDRGVAGLGWA